MSMYSIAFPFGNVLGGEENENCQDRRRSKFPISITLTHAMHIFPLPIPTHAIYPPNPTQPNANSSTKIRCNLPLPLANDYSFPSSALSGILGVPPSLLAGVAVPAPSLGLLFRAPSFNFSHLRWAFSKSAFIFVFSMVRRRTSASSSVMRDWGCWFIALRWAMLDLRIEEEDIAV